MIGRAAGILTAVMVTVIAVTITLALIVYDFFGSDTFSKAWEGFRAARTAQIEKSELRKARGFSFFTSQAVKGYGFEITTGVQFSTLKDLLAGRQDHRWCYVLIQPKSGGVPRQITLAKQHGASQPVFTDLSAYPEDELRSLGVSAKALGEIARTQCRFCCEDGGTSPVGEREASVGRRIRV